MPSKKKKQEFSYCIGRPWYPENPESSICTYAYGSTVFDGTMAQAKAMRNFIESMPDSDGKKYSIYMLTKVPE